MRNLYKTEKPWYKWVTKEELKELQEIHEKKKQSTDEAKA